MYVRKTYLIEGGEEKMEAYNKPAVLDGNVYYPDVVVVNFNYIANANKSYNANVNTNFNANVGMNVNYSANYNYSKNYNYSR